MPNNKINRFTLLAVEALAEAGQMTDPTSKRIMLDVVASYFRLADLFERREALAFNPEPCPESSHGRGVDLAAVDQPRPRNTHDNVGEA